MLIDDDDKGSELIKILFKWRNCEKDFLLYLSKFSCILLSTFFLLVIDWNLSLLV